MGGGGFDECSWGRDYGFTHSDFLSRLLEEGEGDGTYDGRTWDIRLMPMVFFSAQPASASHPDGMDGVSDSAEQVVLVHHFKVRLC